MKENKHIEKELLFKNNIKDITSISLDSDYKIDNKILTGNFIISGDYKTHEISLNREKFNFKIPFKYEIESDIDEDSINVEITDFLYDYKKDELMVNIDYEIKGDRKDVLIFDNEETLDEFLSKREVEVVDTRLEEIKEEITKELEEKIEKKEDIPYLNKEVLEPNKNEKKEDRNISLEEKMNTIKEEINPVTSDEIINSVGGIEDGFVTYKIYKVKENETLESLVIRHKTTIDELKEYNDINNLTVNDKIIIPYYE